MKNGRDTSPYLQTPIEVNKKDYYQNAKTSQLVNDSTLLLVLGNILAACAHFVSFLAAVLVTQLFNENLELLSSTDFVKIEKITLKGDQEKVFGINIDTWMFDPIWIAICIPLITSFFHFLKGVIIPFMERDFSKLRKGKNSAELIFSYYKKYQDSYCTFWTFPHSWFDYYKNVLTFGMDPLRWIEYSVTSSLMVILISSLSGVSNVFLSVSLVVFNVGLMWVGGNYMEQFNKGVVLPLAGNRAKSGKSANWTFYIMGSFFFIWQWVIIMAYFFSAVTSASSSVPVYVYIIIIVMFGQFNLFALNTLLHYSKIFDWFTYSSNYEMVFILLSFVSKLSLDWILIIGLSVNPRAEEIITQIFS